MGQIHPKIMAAKVDAILDPNLIFFSSLICNLKFREDTACQTAWTDGTTLGYNPNYINTLSHSEIIGLLAHEVMHCAGGHPYRRDNRQSKKWNMACDKAINPILTSANIILPKGALTATPDETGKSAEWIYDRLPDYQDNQDNDMPAGEVRDTSGGDGEYSSTSESDWQEIARHATIQAKAMGKLPAGLDRFSKLVAEAKVDWRSELRKFVQQSARDDYTWTRPSMRYAGHGMYMPSLHSEEMPPILIAVDTSGSMDDVALAHAKAEIESIIQDMHPQRVHVMYADAVVARHDVFERDETLTWSPVGFGGTDFRPVFSAIDDIEEKPACVVYITDLCGTFPKTVCEIPTLWVTDSNIKAPFGDTIKIR